MEATYDGTGMSDEVNNINIHTFEDNKYKYLGGYIIYIHQSYVLYVYNTKI